MSNEENITREERKAKGKRLGQQRPILGLLSSTAEMKIEPVI